MMKNEQSVKLSFRAVFISFAIFILSGLNSVLIYAESQVAPTFYYSYDGFVPGAKAMGMGFAFTSVADDPSALYFNPAGLNYLDKNTISITLDAGRQGDLLKDKLFLNEPISNSGLCLIALTSGKGSFSFRPLSDMTIRETSGNDWKTTEIKINAYTVSAAHKSESGIMTGLNISYLSGRIAEAQVENNLPYTNLSDGHGISFDMGFLGNITKELALGINFQNILGNIWWNDFEKEQLPFCIRGGFSFSIPGYTIFATELEKKYYRNEKNGPDETITHFGLEQAFSKILKVRAGVYGADLNDKEKTRLTYGIGYELQDYRLSVAGEKYRMEKTDVYRLLLSFDISI